MSRVCQRCAAFLLSLSAAASAHPVTITVKGSDSLVLVAQKWAETYAGKHPEAKTKIRVAGGGTGAGFAALRNRWVDLAAASRPMKPGEIAECVDSFGKRPTEYKVCLEGLSVYVHEDNPVRELTLGQLKRIFSGQIKDWSQVGGHEAPITVYGREASCDTHEFFKELVLDSADLAAGAQPVAGTAALLRAVSRDKNGIGYGGAACGPGARTLKIKKDSGSSAIEPTEENVLKGLYPIWRYLYLYVNPAFDRGEIAAYLRWIRSDEGQEVVKDAGYFPLPAHLREN
ncbi:MAG TPA: phosphate ABC transporter substrate-binding protein [Candidatus Binatia bacterium]|nr:phosphate ABC transporter substrate-binding protein [Candidatus Binatia bacterium]